MMLINSNISSLEDLFDYSDDSSDNEGPVPDRIRGNMVTVSMGKSSRDICNKNRLVCKLSSTFFPLEDILMKYSANSDMDYYLVMKLDLADIYQVGEVVSLLNCYNLTENSILLSGDQGILKYLIKNCEDIQRGIYVDNPKIALILKESHLAQLTYWVFTDSLVNSLCIPKLTSNRVVKLGCEITYGSIMRPTPDIATIMKQYRNFSLIITHNIRT